MNEISFKNISIIKSSNNLENSRSNEILTAVNDIKKNKKKVPNKTNKDGTQKIPPFYPASTQMSVKNNSWKKTIAENNLVPYENERDTLFSTWTPLSDEKSNQKVFSLFSLKFFFN
jgi:hypothetical protein